MRTVNLDEIKLDKGAHAPDGQFCVMELAAYIAEEPWSDEPKCVSLVIAAFLRSWNDSLDHDTRQMLKPYAIESINTVGTNKQEEERAWMATDWLVRECAPAFLRLAGLAEHAETLERLAALDGTRAAKNAEPSLDAAARAAWGARAASAASAASAAWAARAASAASAARAASAAWAASAASAAWGASAASAASAAWGASAASAASVALEPTVKALQASALLLLDRMIAVGR